MPDAKNRKTLKTTLSEITAPACAICGKPADAVFRPFCSKRCADVDLHRWLSGVYVVPVVTDDEEEDEQRKSDDE